MSISFTLPTSTLVIVMDRTSLYRFRFCDRGEVFAQLRLSHNLLPRVGCESQRCLNPLLQGQPLFAVIQGLLDALQTDTLNPG
ncbi:hypothetical protein D3C81_1957010 [compost metagenome]